MTAPVLWWIQTDLRLGANPALDAALKGGRPVIPVFVWHPESEGAWPVGSASRFWLHWSLTALDRALRERGSRLIVRRGEPAQELRAAARECGATDVEWNRRYEPQHVTGNARVKESLREAGLAAHSHPGAVLLEPFAVENKAGRPFRVFTPFWRHCQSIYQPPALPPPPSNLPPARTWPESLPLDALELLSPLSWTTTLRRHWEPGENGAQAALTHFLSGPVEQYAIGRDQPGHDGVSRLSAALHFGELHPAEVLSRAAAGESAGASAFIRQLYWRDFAVHLLYHFPRTTSEPLNPTFERFPWVDDDTALTAWSKGQTGYPLIDAGMRELWETGWMHNRVRMNVASFLVKHLLLDWRHGARWFWDTLVDADLANNTMGWQWVAGCGADAAPYFRIFNPIGQGERFDPDGRYVRRWVPELRKLPDRWIHRPWEAGQAILQRSNIRLGADYPAPLVDHRKARQRALAAFASLKAG